MINEYFIKADHYASPECNYSFWSKSLNIFLKQNNVKNIDLFTCRVKLSDLNIDFISNNLDKYNIFIYSEPRYVKEDNVFDILFLNVEKNK